MAMAGSGIMNNNNQGTGFKNYQYQDGKINHRESGQKKVNRDGDYADWYASFN